MNDLISTYVNCPYCGERFQTLIDGSVPHQKYIEDCEVCCRPINFDVIVNDEEEMAYVKATAEFD